MSAAPGASEVALFPLNAVLFPGGLLPLRIFERRYLDMASACLKNGAPAEPEAVGCLARIVEWDMQQLGLPEVADAAVPRSLEACTRLLKLAIDEFGSRLIEPPHRFESSAWVSARLLLLRRLLARHGLALPRERKA